jgi:hypothetical protein
MGDLIASQLRILLFEMHSRSSASLEKQLKLVVEPQGAKSAIAKGKINKGSLQLVPVSQSVYCSDKAPSGAVDLGSMVRIGSVQLHGYACTTHKKAEATSSADMARVKPTYEFFAPFWCVQATHKSHEVNMGFELVETTKPGGFMHSGTYYVTVLKNLKELQEGDVLRYAADSKCKYPVHSSINKKRKA